MKTRPYNLPGFGVLRPQLFPHARALYDLLDQAGFIARLETIDQLGSLRAVYPGAHHTRLEYVMVQLAMITEICHLKGVQAGGLGLSSDAAGFQSLDWLKKAPSYGEVVQAFILLANIGHLPQTFAAERSVIAYLRSHTDARRAFRTGLEGEDRPLFDEAVKGFHTYRIHLFMALFQLRRLRRRWRGDELATFGTAVLRSYLRGSDPRGNDVTALWRYFRAIRRLSYLALDALYTPVPFSLDLGSIFHSLRSDGPGALHPESVFQRALIGLEAVMRDAVFLAPEALLQHSRASERILDSLEEEGPDPSITGLKEVLHPGATNKRVFADVDTTPSVNATPGRTLTLGYEVQEADDTGIMVDVMAWERAMRIRMGYRSCRFAAEWDASHQSLRLALGIGAGLKPNVEKRIAFKASRVLAQTDLTYATRLNWGPVQRWPNQRSLIAFLLRATFGWNFGYEVAPAPILGHRGVVFCKGATRAADLAASQIEPDEAWPGADPDSMNEMQCVVDTLRLHKHRGHVLAFMGSAEIRSPNRTIAEFDGVVFCFSTQVPYGSVLLVEEKNTANGDTEAKAQLVKRAGELGWTLDSEDNMQSLGTRGAFCELTWE